MARQTPLERYRDLRRQASQIMHELARVHGATRSEIYQTLRGKPRAENEPAPRGPTLWLPNIAQAIRSGRTDAALRAVANAPAAAAEEKQRLLTELAGIQRQIREHRQAHPDVQRQTTQQRQGQLSIGLELQNLRALKATYASKLQGLGRELSAIEVSGRARSDIYENHHGDYLESMDAIDQRIADLSSEHGAEAVTQELLCRVLQDRQDLIQFRHIRTQTQEELERGFRDALLSGKHLFVWGHTGTGKTSGIVQLFKKEKLNPIIFPCGGETTQSDLFAMGEASSTTGAKGETTTRIGAQPAGIARALVEDRPIILDEANALRPEVMTTLLPILDAISERRTRVYITELNQELHLGRNFRIIFTGNPKSEQYRGREEIDNAMGRRAWNHDVPYPSQEDLNRVVGAELIDPQHLEYPQPALEISRRLAASIHTIQGVYSGAKTDYYGPDADEATRRHSTLRHATAAIDDLRSMLQAWRARNYHGTPDSEVLKFIEKLHAPRDEKSLLAHIFLAHGFLATQPHDRVKQWVSADDWKHWTGKAK